MNKHDVLRAHLMGDKLEDVPKDMVGWATTHQPLLSPSLFTEKGRRLNKFCIGSDPEFAFERPDNPGHRVTAADVKLYVGLAAGADQNERLVELRPWPSHSVVEHVAGILTALRWLYRTNHYAYMQWWRAGAFFAGDGMGGHVHFGRKRPTRKDEISALDGLAGTLRITGLFPIKEWAIRNKGDQFHNAPYGLYGDFRVQQHGYEYRTLPSWLQSPTTAFIALTSSKLAVLDPTVTSSWQKRLRTGDEARNLIRGLAKLYKGRDDDAYLLYHVLTMNGDVPFLINHTIDFKGAWGIPAEQPGDRDRGVILPGSIKPSPEEVKTITNHLLLGQGIGYERLPSTFRGEIPANYIWGPTQIAPARRSGFGDLIHNLVWHKGANLGFNYGPHGEFQVSGDVPLSWTPADERFLRDYYPNIAIERGAGGGGTMITVPKSLCQSGAVTGLRAVLFHSGLFPIWTVDAVKTDSYPKWLIEHPRIKPPAWRDL